MTLVPLLPIFHRLNREYFDSSLSEGDLPILSIRWSDGRLKRTAGFYRHGPKVNGRNRAEIVLSKPLLTHLPFSAIESTLCHEMIHAWIDLVLNIREGHGPNFHRRMAFINGAQNRFQVTVRHQFPIPASPPKWLGICPSCNKSFPYRRIVQGAACRQCCDQYYGGKWHDSCLLSYFPIEKEA